MKEAKILIYQSVKHNTLGTKAEALFPSVLNHQRPTNPNNKQQQQAAYIVENSPGPKPTSNFLKESIWIKLLQSLNQMHHHHHQEGAVLQLPLIQLHAYKKYQMLQLIILEEIQFNVISHLCTFKICSSTNIVCTYNQNPVSILKNNLFFSINLIL